MSATAIATNPLTTARMQELDYVEKDVIAILENAGRHAGWLNRIKDLNLTCKELFGPKLSKFDYAL